jgi:hypothetical protein
VPEPPAGDRAAAHRLAREMYAVSRVAMNGGCPDPLLYDLMSIERDFHVFEDTIRSDEPLIRLNEFICRFRDNDVRVRLAPVAWVGVVRT